MNMALIQPEQLSVPKLYFMQKSRTVLFEIQYIQLFCQNQLLSASILTTKEAFKISKSAETVSSKGYMFRVKGKPVFFHTILDKIFWTSS